MPLTWQYPEKVWTEMSEHDKKNREVFLTGSMVCDLGEVTEENVKEWIYRLSFAQKLNGIIWWKDGKPWMPSLKEVRAHIGFTCNVSTKSRLQFEKKEITAFRDCLMSKLEKEEWDAERESELEGE